MPPLPRVVLPAALLLAACRAAPTPSAVASPQPPALAPPAAIRDGGIQVVQVDGKYNVWTKRQGEGRVAMLLLPGGPGCSHDYFAPFEDYLPRHGVQLVFYDPLGTGRSDRPTDASLWRLDRFVEEVEQVRVALGLDGFYLLGHSWGGILAIEYALRHPGHLRGLVVSNAPASTRAIDEYGDALLARDTSPETLGKVRALEARGVHDGAEYDALFDAQAWADHHMARLPHPWPEPLVYGCFGGGANATQSETVFGAHRSFQEGNLRDWNRWGDLARIAVPTLAIASTYDFVAPSDLKRIAASVQHGRVALTAGSHMDMYDDQPAYFSALLGFIDAVEAGKPL